MKNQIDKIYIVLGAIAMAVFNAVIPNLFIKETPEFIASKQQVEEIKENKAVFPRPQKIYTPQDMEKFRDNKTSPLFTATTYLYERNVYSGNEQGKDFNIKLCSQIAECEVFINYSIPTVTFITTATTQTTAPTKNIPKCEKPTLAVESKVGNVELVITPGAATFSTVNGFNIFRNDKGEEKPYLIVGASELKIIDDKVEPDKEYKYKIQQICISTEGGEKILSDFSDERSASAKRKYYVKCYNVGTTASAAKIHVLEYKDDGSAVEGVSLIKVKSEIKIPASKIATGFIIISINTTKKVRHNNKLLPQYTVKYCKLDAQKQEGELEERCEINSIVEMECIFEEPRPKKSDKKPSPPPEKGKEEPDKKGDEKPENEKEPKK